MATASWEHQDEAREALRYIVSEPGYGAAVLSNPQTMTSLLKDLLPDAPREKSVLIAASEAGVASMLADHVSHGMDLATASALTIASFTEHTGYPDDVGGWVVGEMSQALGLGSAAPGTIAAGGTGDGQWTSPPGPVAPAGVSSATIPPATAAPPSGSPGSAQWNNPAGGPAPAETILPGQPPPGQTGPMPWGSQPPGPGPAAMPGAYQPGAGYPYGGAPQPGQAGRGRRRTGLIVAIAAVAVVIVGVVIYVATKPSGPKSAPVEALSKVEAPMIRSSQITDCNHVAPISGLTGVTASQHCSASGGTIRVYLDQFGSTSAYQSGFSRTDTFLGYPSGTHPFCGPTENATCNSQWWSNTQPKYSKRPGQVLQEHYVNHNGTSVATFVWTLPSQRVVIVAQSDNGTLPNVYSWWRHLSYG